MSHPNSDFNKEPQRPTTSEATEQSRCNATILDWPWGSYLDEFVRESQFHQGYFFYEGYWNNMMIARWLETKFDFPPIVPPAPCLHSAPRVVQW